MTATTAPESLIWHASVTGNGSAFAYIRTAKIVRTSFGLYLVDRVNIDLMPCGEIGVYDDLAEALAAVDGMSVDEHGLRVAGRVAHHNDEMAAPFLSSVVREALDAVGVRNSRVVRCTVMRAFSAGYQTGRDVEAQAILAGVE